MTKKIKVTSPVFGVTETRADENDKVNDGVREGDLGLKVRVRVIRAPLVNQDDLRNVVFSRARAVVL